MHGLVLLDDKDNLLRPAILWNDGRTQEEAAARYDAGYAVFRRLYPALKSCFL